LYKADVTGINEGKSYVVFGKSNTNAVDLSSIAAGTGGFAINGKNAWDRSGDPVSSAGDVNGDGLDDLIVGAHSANTYTGKSYVIFGKTNTIIKSSKPSPLTSPAEETDLLIKSPDSPMITKPPVPDSMLLIYQA
jgi:hypothetical protein